MIKINSMSFGHHGIENLVLKNCQIYFEKEISYGILGKNGSGKSTLLELIMGLRNPNMGEIFVNDISMSGPMRHQARFEVTLIDFKVALPPASHKKDIYNLFSCLYPRFSKDKADGILSRFDITFSKRLDELSTGQQVKVQLAINLATNANFFLIDEVTAVLDPGSRAETFKILQEEILEGSSYILATNIAEDVLQYTSRVALLREGAIEFVEHQEVERYFNLKVA